MNKEKLLSNENPKLRIAAQVAVLAVVIVFPFVSSSFFTELMAKFLAFALVALSYDLIWGYAGIANFGHAIFFGLGAYSFGLALAHIQIPGATYIAYLAAILVPMFVGMFLSVFLFYGKVIGSFFAVITMCLGAAFESIAMAWTSVTGGMNGLYRFPAPRIGIPGLWEIEVSSADVRVPFYLNSVILIIVLMFMWAIMKKRNFGKVISAIKNDERRAAYLGYSVNLYKSLIFTISCGVAGLAGALYVPVGTITPSVLGMGFSIQILVWVAVGGRGSLWGPIVGAMAVSLMKELLSGAVLNYWLIILGVFFILVVMFWPKGFAGFVDSFAGKKLKNKFSKRGNL